MHTLVPILMCLLGTKDKTNFKPFVSYQTGERAGTTPQQRHTSNEVPVTDLVRINIRHSSQIHRKTQNSAHYRTQLPVTVTPSQLLRSTINN